MIIKKQDVNYKSEWLNQKKRERDMIRQVEMRGGAQNKIISTREKNATQQISNKSTHFNSHYYYNSQKKITNAFLPPKPANWLRLLTFTSSWLSCSLFYRASTKNSVESTTSSKKSNLMTWQIQGEKEQSCSENAACMKYIS